MEAEQVTKVERNQLEEETFQPFSLELPSYPWTVASLKTEIKCEEDIKNELQPEASVKIEEDVQIEIVEDYHQLFKQESTNPEESALDIVETSGSKRCYDQIFASQVIPCTDCMNLLPPEHLQENLIFSHVGGQDFRCPFCSSQYKYHFQLTRHLPSHFEQEIPRCKPTVLKCTLCPNTFTSVKELVQHRVNHSQQFRWKCSECSQRFPPEDFEEHMSTKHPGVKFKTPQLNSRKTVTKLPKINPNQAEQEMIFPDIQENQPMTVVQTNEDYEVTEKGMDTPYLVKDVGVQCDIEPADIVIKKKTKVVCCPCTSKRMSPDKYSQVICFQHMKLYRYGEEPVNLHMKEQP